MKKTLKALIVLLGLLFPALAFAATLGDTATSTVITDVLQIAGYAIGLLVMTLIGIAASKVASHFNVKIPATWQTMINGYLDKAISYAEEWGRNQILSNKSVTGNDKLEAAFQFLMNIAGDDKRLVSMADDEIKKLIEAHLGEQRSFNALSSNEMAAMPAGGVASAQLNLPTMADRIKKVEKVEKLADGGDTKPPQAGFTLLHTMVILSVVGLVLGACAWFKGSSPSATAVKGGINCLVGKLFDEAMQYAPSLESNIQAAVDPTTGKVNWPSLDNVTAPLKSDAAGCALKIAVDYFTKMGTGSGAQPMQVDQQSLIAGYNAVLAKQFGGKTFVTSAVQ